MDKAAAGENMKAPGGKGEVISRESFERNPQGYFADLHAKEKNPNTEGHGMMKAPGGDGAGISRDAFEKNPQGYFSDLHAREKCNK